MEIKTARAIYCSTKCEHLAFVASYCDLFRTKLDFGTTKYERCRECRRAEGQRMP